ncbi:MAG: hypothetical protein ACRDP1_16190 [Nocardioidaceae bacterium]
MTTVPARMQVVAPRARLVAALLVVAAGPVSVVLSQASSPMPKQVPVQWSGNVAIGAASSHLLLAWCLAFGVLGLLLGVPATVLERRGRIGARRLLLLGAGLSGIGAGVWWLIRAVVHAAPDRSMPWSAPAPGGLLAIVPVVALGLVGGVVTACGSRDLPVVTVAPKSNLPRVALPETGPAEWHRPLHSQFFLAAVGVLVVVGAGVFAFSPTAAIIAWVLAGLTTLFVRTGLRVDDSSISLQGWLIPVRMRIDYAHVVEARAKRVNPWWFRGRRYKVLPSHAPVLLRSGPAFVVVLSDGRRVALMMDHPDVPAGIVNSHLDRLRGPASRADAR